MQSRGVLERNVIGSVTMPSDYHRYYVNTWSGHTHDYKKVHKIVLHHIPPRSKTNRRFGPVGQTAQWSPESCGKVSFNPPVLNCESEGNV